MKGRRTSFALDRRFSPVRYPGIARYADNLWRALVASDAAEELVQIVGSPGPEAAPGPAPPSRAPLSQAPLSEVVGGLASSLVASSSPRSFAEQLDLRRLARAAELAVFHSPFWWTAQALPCPLIVTVYDAIPMIDREFLPSPWKRLLFRVGARLTARRARRVLTLSRAARSELSEQLGIEKERIVVTSPAADPLFRPVAPDEVAKTLGPMALPERYVLYVGSNRPHKNLLRLVEAFARLAAKDRDAHLVVAGPWDPRFELAKRFAEEHHLKVRFLGYVGEDTLPSLYGGAALVVLPSLSEGLGFSALEAMACGAVLACSEVPALVEVVGEAALTFDPKCVEAITSAMAIGLGDRALRARLSARALEVSSRFSWRRTASETLDVYRSVADGA